MVSVLALSCLNTWQIKNNKSCFNNIEITCCTCSKRRTTFERMFHFKKCFFLKRDLKYAETCMYKVYSNTNEEEHFFRVKHHLSTLHTHWELSDKG